MQLGTRLFMFTALAFPLLGGASGAQTPAKPAESPVAVAVVNGEEIGLDRLEQRLVEMHSEAVDGTREKMDLDRLLFRMVNDALIAQDARALGMDKEPKVVDRVHAVRTRLAVSLLEKQEIQDKAEPTDEELANTYKLLYERLNLRVITVKTIEQAEEVLSKVNAGGDMAALAQELSIDPYRIKKGYVEGLPRRDVMTEVADLAATLDPGQVGGPIVTSLGYSVIKLESRQPAEPEKYEERRRTVEAYVRARKTERLRSALATLTREKHPVRIVQELVAKIQPEALEDGQLIPSIRDADTVLAHIGDSRTINAEQLAGALAKRWKRVRNQEAARAATPLVLDDLIMSTLLEVEAFSRGLQNHPRIQAAARDLETQMLITEYLDRIVGKGIEITPQEMQEEYDAHLEQFKRPARVRLGQITVATEEEAARHAQLLREGADLAWIARSHSTDRFAQAGGDRGWMVPDGPDEGHRLLREASAGDVLDPMGIPDNYVVLKILAKQDQGYYSLREVSGNIRSALYSRKFSAVLHTYVTRMRERAEIQINQAVISKLRIQGQHDPTSAPEKEGMAHGH